MIDFPEEINRSFLYVDCGARGESNHPFVSTFPGVQYIGFEADPNEAAKVQIDVKNGGRIFPVALGNTNAKLPFYVTRNPACSSFLEPDSSLFSRFLDASADIEIETRVELPVVTLDDYLPSIGIVSVDFMELDTQGSELSILRGSERFLKNTILGLRIEVEFFPIYKNQPLFADVDVYARSHGFELFDLSRYRYRRAGAPKDISTIGQIVYGHALYLRSYRTIQGDDAWIRIIKLIMIADYFGLYDYAYEMIDHLEKQPNLRDKEKFLEIFEEYKLNLAPSTRTHIILNLIKYLRLQKFFERLLHIGEKLSGAYRTAAGKNRKSWVD